MEDTQRFTNKSTKRQWMAEQARTRPEAGIYLTASSDRHRLDARSLRTNTLTRKDVATGIDGVTAADYKEDLDSNPEDLLNRIKSGPYVAPAMRWHWMPKGDGRSLPLGIPTFEGKVVQRAIRMLLEPIYEQDFESCSYGFRPRRGFHDSLDAILSGVMAERSRWVIDADVEKFFDTIRHDLIREALDLRGTDRVVRRMIDEWLKVGMLEEGI